MDILAEKITKLNEELSTQIPIETLEAFQKSIQELKEKQIENNCLNVGEAFPDFKLYNLNNDLIKLQNLLNNKKIIIAFLRGSWCPYCNLELKELQNNIKNFHNSQLLIISPQPEHTNSEWLKQSNSFFEILVDSQNKLAEKVGINFSLQDFVIPHYEKLGIDLQKINQTKNYTLPIPAVFVLDKNGIIIYKFVNANYMQRVNINELTTHL